MSSGEHLYQKDPASEPSKTTLSSLLRAHLPRNNLPPMSRPSWLPVEDTPSETLESNWLFDLKREPYRSRQTGQIHDYYVLHLADAVNVIAVTPDRRVVLVRQFRAGSQEDSLETPGGLVNEGEDVLSAAARELREETGYEGDPPIPLGTCWSNPSIMTSRITSVLITNARPTADRCLDHNEEVHVELAHAGRIPQMIRDGRINHALVVQGLLLWLVSEIPDQPLETVFPERDRRQFHIRNMLIWIAVAAGLFGLIANLGRLSFLILSMVFAVATIYLLRRRDPCARSILLRGRRVAFVTVCTNGFAWLGAWLFWLALGMAILSIFH